MTTPATSSFKIPGSSQTLQVTSELMSLKISFTVHAAGSEHFRVEVPTVHAALVSKMLKAVEDVEFITRDRAVARLRKIAKRVEAGEVTAFDVTWDGHAIATKLAEATVVPAATDAQDEG